MNGGAWWATVHRVAKSWTLLSNFTYGKLKVFHQVSINTLKWVR